MDIEEYVIAQEDHQDGTKHLHAFIKVSRKIQWSATRFDFPDHHGNYQVAKSWNAVKKYVQKGGNFISSIDVESAQQKRGKHNKAILEMGVKAAVDAGLISLHQVPNVQRGINIYRSQEPPYDHPDVRGQWYVGEPKTGKSLTARTRHPEAYIKAQNKWWDGYTGQQSVILDDLDKGGVCLGHYLKIWADRYACQGEVKGGHVNLQHRALIVTSNYTIEQLWGEEPEMCEAIKRRFEVTRFLKL